MRDGWRYYAGAENVQSWFKGEMSPLGIAVANLLGEMVKGIYHLDVNKVDWAEQRRIVVNIDKYGTRLSTWDWDELTRLVFLCHDRALRVEIEPCNFRIIRLIFSQRTSRIGDFCTRHPTVEMALENHRERYPIEDAVVKFDVDQSLESVERINNNELPEQRRGGGGNDL